MIQNSPLYISCTKAISKDYLSYVLLYSDEEIVLFEDLDSLLKEDNLIETELIKNIKDKQKDKKVIIMSRGKSKELIKYQALGINIINVSKKGKTYNFNILNTKNNILVSTSFGKETC